MTNLIINNLQRLLSQYTFETEANSISEDLSCSICSKLTIDAYQTSCGCIYCRECIVKHLSEGNNYCPGGKEECQEDLLVLDDNVRTSTSLNNKITKMRVHCPNRLCVFISPLDVMGDHLRVCGQQQLHCPYRTIGCHGGEEFKERIETHLSDETLTHSMLLMEAINNLRNELGAINEYIRGREESGVEEMVKREMEDERKSRKDEKQRLIELMKEQTRGINKRMEEQKLEIFGVLGDRKKDIEELTKKIERLEDEAKKRESEERAADLKEEVRTLREDLDAGRVGLREMVSEVEAMKRGATEFRENTTLTLDALEAMRRNEILEGEEREAHSVRQERCRVDMLNVGTNGVVAVGRSSFTVDNFSERMKKDEEIVYSPYVYSHTNGYKLRLRVHPGGALSGIGSHLSVGSVVCYGEYDEVLSWPFRESVFISVINQRTQEPHMIMVNSYCSLYKHNFKKPLNKDNIALGNPALVSHNDLRSVDGLIVNDAVLLLVTIRHPSVDVVSFTVDRFRSRCEANETVYSPYFYTHTNGYKLRLQVHPGGWGDCKGTHVSVYSVLCRGEHDDILVWPCTHGITIGVINQRSRETYKAETIICCDNNKECFNKPIHADNNGRGWHSFISHADLLFVEGLLINDSVVLLVAVSPPL